MFHITINGKPACLRDTDGIALIEEAHRLHVGLGCSRSRREELERAAELYRKHHPEWGEVVIVEGECPGLNDL